MARKSQRIRRQRRINLRNSKEKADNTSKTIEDSSAILEGLIIMSNKIDNCVNKIDIATKSISEPPVIPASEVKTQPTVSMRAEPVVEMKEEPSVEMTIQPFNEPTLIAPKKTLNFKKMTKRNLLSYAKENNIAVRSTMTKTQIIKAINKS